MSAAPCNSNSAGITFATSNFMAMRRTVDRTFDLPQTPEALEELIAGRVRGKAVITV